MCLLTKQEMNFGDHIISMIIKSGEHMNNSYAVIFKFFNSIDIFAKILMPVRLFSQK